MQCFHLNFKTLWFQWEQSNTALSVCEASVKTYAWKWCKAAVHLHGHLLSFYCGLLKLHRPELLLRICRRVIQFAINMSALSIQPAPRISNCLVSQQLTLQIHSHRAQHRGINEWCLCMLKRKKNNHEDTDRQMKERRESGGADTRVPLMPWFTP